MGPPSPQLFLPAPPPPLSLFPRAEEGTLFFFLNSKNFEKKKKKEFRNPEASPFKGVGEKGGLGRNSKFEIRKSSPFFRRASFQARRGNLFGGDFEFFFGSASLRLRSPRARRGAALRLVGVERPHPRLGRRTSRGQPRCCLCNYLSPSATTCINDSMAEGDTCSFLAMDPSQLD